LNGLYPGRCLPGCVAARPGSQAAICQSQTARQLLRPGANRCSCAKGVTSHPPLTLSPIHSLLKKYIEQEGWEDQARVKKKEGKEMEWRQSIHNKKPGRNTYCAHFDLLNGKYCSGRTLLTVLRSLDRAASNDHFHLWFLW